MQASDAARKLERPLIDINGHFYILNSLFAIQTFFYSQ
jgi:hypothetical protein